MPFRAIFLIAATSMAFSCSTEQAETFDPLFHGMPSGAQTREGCIRFDDFSIQTQYAGLESEASVYSGSSCGGVPIYQAQVAADTQVAGIWSHYLVLDYGTGPDSREIELVVLEEGKPDFRSTYVMDPEFSGQSLSFYKSAEEMVSPDKCGEAEEQARTWSEMGLGVGMAEKMAFQSGDTEAAVEPGVTCYPIQ